MTHEYILLNNNKWLKCKIYSSEVKEWSLKSLIQTEPCLTFEEWRDEKQIISELEKNGIRFNKHRFAGTMMAAFVAPYAYYNVTRYCPPSDSYQYLDVAAVDDFNFYYKIFTQFQRGGKRERENAPLIKLA